MAVSHYKATVKENGWLELKDGFPALDLKPGDSIDIQINLAQGNANHAISVLRELAERRKVRRGTDGSHTLALIREARNGGMYDYESDE